MTVAHATSGSGRARAEPPHGDREVAARCQRPQEDRTLERRPGRGEGEQPGRARGDVVGDVLDRVVVATRAPTPSSRTRRPRRPASRTRSGARVRMSCGRSPVRCRARIVTMPSTHAAAPAVSAPYPIARPHRTPLGSSRALLAHGSASAVCIAAVLDQQLVGDERRAGPAALDDDRRAVGEEVGRAPREADRGRLAAFGQHEADVVALRLDAARHHQAAHLQRSVTLLLARSATAFETGSNSTTLPLQDHEHPDRGARRTRAPRSPSAISSITLVGQRPARAPQALPEPARVRAERDEGDRRNRRRRNPSCDPSGRPLTSGTVSVCGFSASALGRSIARSSSRSSLPSSSSAAAGAR